MAADLFPPPLSFMDTPVWMQVVERRLKQAAEDARSSRPAKAGIHAYSDAGAPIDDGAVHIFRRMI